MLKIAIAAALLTMAAGADAAGCRDAKGKFIKCVPAAAAAKSLPPGITKDAKGKCHGAGGKFVKCPS